MKSAKTIRVCSTIMMIINIIASILMGIRIGWGYSEYYGEFYWEMLVVWIVGIFCAVLLNAVLHGFADLIDNTYATACKANGVRVMPINNESNGNVIFTAVPVLESEGEEKYAKSLLDKGIINQTEYNEMIEKN